MEQKMRFFGRALLMQLGLYLGLSLALDFLPSSFVDSMQLRAISKILVFIPPIVYYSISSGYRPFAEKDKKNIKAFNLMLYYIFGLCATVSVTNLVGWATECIIGIKTVAVFTSIPNAMWSLVISVILAAVFEETLFRGAFFHASEGQNRVCQIILCSLFFALMHYSLFRFFYALAAGIVISVLFAKTQSLLFSVLLHAGANFVTWLFAFARLFVNTTMLELAFVLIFAVIGAAGVIVWLLTLKKTPENSDGERFVCIGAEGAVYAVLAIIFTAASF